MVDYAEMYFHLDVKGKDGSTKRDHLMIVAETTNTVPIELQDLPELPESATHIWEWFLDLNGARHITEMGQSPLSFLDIEAWSRLTKNSLAVWEVKALKAIDRAFLNRGK